MTDVTFISHEGNARTLELAEGVSVMHAAVQNGVEGIVGECGGVLSCATCHVFVDEADYERLAPMDELEDELLDGAAEDRSECSRLSCRIKLPADFGTLHVTTPEFQE